MQPRTICKSRSTPSERRAATGKTGRRQNRHGKRPVGSLARFPYIGAKKQHSDKATIESLFKAYRKAAENAPALVFLDDMDKLAESEDDYYNQDAFTAIQSCMEDTKHCNVVTIATVNDTDCLPSSLLRKGRFDVVLTIGLPSRKEAEQIIAHYLQNKPINKRSVRASDLAALLTGYSCADLETVLNEAMSLAVYERKAVLDNRHIVETIMTSLYEILPYDYPANAEELTETAVSIAGKLTAAVTAKHISPYFATVCGGGALYYNTLPEYGDSVESLREEMCMRLAGSAAVGLHSGVQDATAREISSRHTASLTNSSPNCVAAGSTARTASGSYTIICPTQCSNTLRKRSPKSWNVPNSMQKKFCRQTKRCSKILKSSFSHINISRYGNCARRKNGD